MQTRYDVAIVGGGPAGLACACLAAGQGLGVVVLERAGPAALAMPPPDGRDIALTHRSLQILDDIGAWSGIPVEEVSPIARAAVRNGAAPDLMRLGAERMGRAALGFIVANNIIRAALFRRATAIAGIELRTGVRVTDVVCGADEGRVTLESGEVVAARVVVAADSRFSETRRKAGIGAEMRDFGRVCIVCRMAHDEPHDGTAHEWFDTDQTLAALPLNGRLSSIVVTLPADAAARAMAWTPEAFAADVERRFGGRWGRMRLVGERHPYPLVAVFANRFHTHRFALVGDAAVGMHPVTAHGFNFGLAGAARLAAAMGAAARVAADIGSDDVLARYDREHRHATWPLYMATNAIVGLYTDNGPLARVARHALLKVGDALTPIKDLITAKLTEIDDTRTVPATTARGPSLAASVRRA